MLVNRSLGMLWRAKSCSAKDKICSGGIALPLGANRGLSVDRRGLRQTKGISVMKIIIRVTTAFFALLSTAGFIAMLSTIGLLTVLSAAAAADLPRKEPPPPAPPVGKAPIGKHPIGKYLIGKYPQPVVTKG